MARDDRRALEQAAQVRGTRLLARVGPQRLQVGREGAVGPEQGLDRHRRDDVDHPQERLQVVEREDEHAEDPVRPVDQREALLRREHERRDAGFREGLGGRTAPALAVVDLAFPISTSAQWASGARSPLAPSEPCSGTTGASPALRSAASVSATNGRVPTAHRQRAGAQEEHRPHDLALDRVAHACGVRPDERPLQLLAPFRRDRRVASEPKPVETP